MFDSFWDMTYPCVIVISEGESKSGPCQVCKDHHGTYPISSKAELEKLELPPYHPNCFCEVEFRVAAENGLKSTGTRLEMMEVLQSAKKIFNDVCHAYKTKGMDVLLNWWGTRFIGAKNPDLACRQRAQVLLNRFNSEIPKRDWFAFRHVRGHWPRVKKNISHSWVELELQYIHTDHSKRKVRVKYDPYYHRVEYLEPWN